MVGKGSAENLHLQNNEAEDVYEPLHIRLIDNYETDTVITIQHAHEFHSSISIMQIRDRVVLMDFSVVIRLSKYIVARSKVLQRTCFSHFPASRDHINIVNQLGPESDAG